MRRSLFVLTGVLALSLPGPAWAECTTPELPVVGCVVPGEPSASPAPTPVPTEAPVDQPVNAPVAEPAPAPVLTSAPLPVVAPAPVTVLAVPVALPRVEPVLAPVPAAPVTQAAPRAVTPVAAAAPASSLTGAVTGAFALVAFGLIALALLLGFLAGLHNPDGVPVKTARPRLWTGLGVLGLAALVGLLGWYRISDEPLLNRQIPLLASAGIVVVVLSALGGALLVAEQLRGDGRRIADLEQAVRTLTDALASQVEQPPRRAELRSVDVLQN